MYQIEQTDCFEWLRHCPPHSLQAVCTDPPYGILEFTEKELAKLRAGHGGVWRLPPKVGGSHRKTRQPREIAAKALLPSAFFLLPFPISVLPQLSTINHQPTPPSALCRPSTLNH